MEEPSNKNIGEAAAFQRIWLESVSRMMQAAFTASPDSPPPELLSELRTGIFHALAASWDKFMRSPQFLESLRQWMENAIAFRKLSNDFMARVRTELQAPSRGDLDSVILNVRHMEKRLLDRMDEISAQLGELKKPANADQPLAEKPASTSDRRPARPTPKRAATNGKASLS